MSGSIKEKKAGPRMCDLVNSLTPEQRKGVDKELAKLEITETVLEKMKEAGLTEETLAEEMGWKRKRLEKFLDGRKITVKSTGLLLYKIRLVKDRKIKF